MQLLFLGVGLSSVSARTVVLMSIPWGSWHGGHFKAATTQSPFTPVFSWSQHWFVWGVVWNFVLFLTWAGSPSVALTDFILTDPPAPPPEYWD